MSHAKNGDTVTVKYKARLDDGSVFDSTEDREPLEFRLGAGQLIQGFEEAVVGMSPGESKSVELPPDKAFGQRRDDMVVAIARSEIPPNVEPRVGQAVRIQLKDGQPVEATVTQVSDLSVIVDANHPLAGRLLTFEIELLEVD